MFLFQINIQFSIIMKKAFVISSILVVFTTSCLKDLICINGNGILETELRTSTGFNGIVNSTSIDVIYKKADSVSISVRAESNLFSHIVTETVDGSLEIRTVPGSSCFDFVHQPVITVTSPELSTILSTGSGALLADTLSGVRVSVKLTGSGDVTSGTVICGDLSITITGSGNIDITKASCDNPDFLISGSGDISIRGDSDTGQLRISGSGNINAGEFRITTATEIISGSGNIYTMVENSLNATISGSGNIYVNGNPVINQNISGSGRIIKY